MAAYRHELTPPPKDERARELWIQHAAGFILFEDSRAYALDRIDPGLDPKIRAAIVKGIDDALYGLMMIVDGVSGRLWNDSDEVSLAMVVRHSRRPSTGSPITELDLIEGDGMCMGIHGWREGDFGKYPPAVLRPVALNKPKPGSKLSAGKVSERTKHPKQPTKSRKK